MTFLYDRARMDTTSTGTGTVTLGSAVSGYDSFVGAGVSDGNKLNYVIEEGSAWERGNGIYTTSGTTMTRVLIDSSTGSLLTLTGTAHVFIDTFATDSRGRPAAFTLVFG